MDDFIYAEPKSCARDGRNRLDRIGAGLRPPLLPPFPGSILERIQKDRNGGSTEERGGLSPTRSLAGVRLSCRGASESFRNFFRHLRVPRSLPAQSLLEPFAHPAEKDPNSSSRRFL